MTDNSRDQRPGDRARSLTSLLGILCIVTCVILGLFVLGVFIVTGLAMSRYGSNK